MKNHNNITYKSCLLLGIICLGITACSANDPSIYPLGTYATTPPYVIVQSSAVVYTTMEEITNEASTIIIGRPVGERGIVNTARDPNDLSKPDSEYFGIGQVYEVEVISYIKGEAANTLYVIQSHGQARISSQELSESDIEQGRQRENIIPLSLNENYVMFLNPAEYAYGDFPIDQLFGGRGHPWRFRINELDCVLPEDSIDLLRYFPAQSLDSFINSIENPSVFTESYPYPAPENGNLCDINQPFNPYP
jgi:hypothetical protein